MTLLKWPEAISGAAQAQDLDLLVDKLTATPWFSSPEASKTKAEGIIQNYLAECGIDGLTIRWVNKDQLPSVIPAYELSQDPIWPQLYELPEVIRLAAERKGVSDALSFLLSDVPEYVFHAIYDGAFRTFEQQGAQVIQHAVVTALYITSLSASWTAVCEQANPLEKLLDVCRLGYLPIGVKNGEFLLS